MKHRHWAPSTTGCIHDVLSYLKLRLCPQLCFLKVDPTPTKEQAVLCWSSTSYLPSSITMQNQSIFIILMTKTIVKLHATLSFDLSKKGWWMSICVIQVGLWSTLKWAMYYSSRKMFFSLKLADPHRLRYADSHENFFQSVNFTLQRDSKTNWKEHLKKFENLAIVLFLIFF